MYQNHDSIHKQKCRNIVYNLVKEMHLWNKTLNKQTNILTLPSTNFLLEEKVLQMDALNLHCVEYDEEVFRQQTVSNEYKYLKNAYNNRFILDRADVFDFILQKPTSYDVMWIDLCGPLGIRLINRIFSLFQSGKLAPTCYIVLTLMASREQNAKTIADFYGCSSIEEFRRKGLISNCVEFANVVGRNCKCIHTYRYRSELKEKSAPMTFYIFKIN